MRKPSDLMLAGIPVEPHGQLSAAPTEEDLRALIEYAGRPLPSDYLDIVRQYDGFAAWFGDEDEPAYIQLDSCSETVEANESHRLRERGSTLFAVGGDGGGEAFAIDLKTGEWVVVNWADIGSGKHEIRFPTLRAMLDAFIEDTVFG